MWRLLLVDRGDHAALARVRTVVGKLLDRVAASTQDTHASLKAVADQFLEESIARSYYDWRYHLVRYPTMRQGNSGIYYGADGRLGYELTMLRKTVQRSMYRDAYLYAVWCEAGRPSEVEDPWFYGYSTIPRWMKLTRSGTGLRSVPTGIAVQVPATPAAVAALLAVCSHSGAASCDEGWLLLSVHKPSRTANWWTPWIVCRWPPASSRSSSPPGSDQGDAAPTRVVADVCGAASPRQRPGETRDSRLLIWR